MPTRILYIVLFILSGFTSFAQTYPVQGSLAIASPYSCNLSDYTNANMQNLALNLTLADVMVANKRVRLKLFIQTQNAIIAQSTDNVQGEPVIMLDGGIPQRLSNTELAPYFRLENLQGMVPDTYARSLPEGVYTISFEVYDYFTGNRLSGRIGQTFWLIINDPPLLNTPADKSKIADFASPSGSGGIVFNWTPRSTQVSNTEYELTLCELWDPQGDPYQQFLAAIPKYKTTVSNATTFIYTLADPPLVSGYWYAWRVRAKAKAGFEDVGLYRNDGYSNIYTFRYGDPCPAPQNLKAEVKSHDQVNLTWDAPSVSSSLGGGPGAVYKVAYRKYTLAGSYNWTETDATNTFDNITNLEPSTEYEFKVGIACSASALSSGEVIYTSSQRATTLEQGKIAGIECGKEPAIDISNRNPISLLKVNDVVMAGDFPVTLFKISGTPASWSGEGWVRVPWLADTRIHVTFRNIQVNTDYKLIAGSFDTVYDPKGKNIADVDEAINDAAKVVTNITTPKDSASSNIAAYSVSFVITDSIAEHSTFIPNENRGGTITFANGQTLAVDSVPTNIKDTDGNIYNVDKEGKLFKQEELGDAGSASSIAPPSCGCKSDLVQSIMNGDCEPILKSLQAIKKAFSDNNQVTLYKSALLNGRVEIDALCIPNLYFDMSWIKEDKVTFDPAKYEITESVSTSDTKFWAIKYDNILEIKIPKSEENAEKEIRTLAKWLFGGETTSNTSNEIYLPDTNKDIKWISQFNESLFGQCKGCWPFQSCCYRAARKIIQSAGADTDRSLQIIVSSAQANDCGDTKGIQDQFTVMTNVIDISLTKHKLPIIVGVNHPYSKGGWHFQCSGNSPKWTNHYIVIVGKGYDSSKQSNFYYFYEVGTGGINDGRSKNNRLYIDKNSKMLIGNTTSVEYENYYKVTEVRKNKNQKY